MDTSFKGIVFNEHDQVLLGFNPRREWELLGGRADPLDASPEATISRELVEEANLAISVSEIVDIWYYDIAREGRVAVASYLAFAEPGQTLRNSDEHGTVKYFPIDEIDQLNMPDGYKSSIRMAYNTLSSRRNGEHQ